MKLIVDLNNEVYNNFIKNEYTRMDVIAVHNAIMLATLIGERRTKMLHMDEIRMDAHLFDVEFAMRILKEHRKDDDDEYAAAFSIVYELARKWKDYYTHSPRIYRGKEKTLQLVSDTLESGDRGYFTDGELFHKIYDKPLDTLQQFIKNDNYIFIRFFDGRADFEFMYAPDGKKEVGND